MILAQGILEQSSTAKHELGTIYEAPDGRKFVYCSAGASALAAGKLLQAAAPEANHSNKAVKAAAAIGVYKVTGAIGATALTADMYKDGWLHINDATGEGHGYRIETHLAYSASGAACVYHLKDAIRVALAASTSEYTLCKPRGAGVILCPTTLTSVPMGVPLIAVTAGYYFWSQVKGPAAVLQGGSGVIGTGVVPSAGSGAVAGAVMPEASGSITVRVGTLMRVNASTEYSLVNLNIPGF